MHLIPLPLQIRGAKDVVVFLFNDFLLIVKPKLFLRKAATPADLEPFGKNEFIIYRNVSCVPMLLSLRINASQWFSPALFGTVAPYVLKFLLVYIL